MVNWGRSRAALGLRPPVDRARARTDGCSFYPEGNVDDPELWRDCCVAHDMAYWQGGTADERRGADVQLSDCVLARTGSPGLAKRMYRGVRLSGAPLLPTTFRWAYGWGFGRGYAPLDATERQRAAGGRP